MTTYLISYGVYFDGTFESHEIRIKNCTSEWHAKARLGGYVAKKYRNYERLEVYSIKQDIFNGLFPWT